MKTLKFHGIHPMYDTFMLDKLIYQLYSTVILSPTDHHFNKTNFLLGQLIKKNEISRVSEFIFLFSKWLIPKSQLVFEEIVVKHKFSMTEFPLKYLFNLCVTNSTS